ncbi:MAG TPA: trigger factor [Acidimicrobiales bacterium]|nr:trigger factor [Acidimicrobiales bacterium]
MRATLVPLDGHTMKLTVEVGEDEILAARDETIGRLTREARLPGFRPGKVPRRVLEARLGAKAIREQVLAEALPRYYDEAVEEQELDVIAQPEIDITSGQEGGTLVFDAVVQVRPQVSIPGYEGLAVTLARPEATDEEVQAQLDRLRGQFAQLSDVARPAAPGDVLTLDVHASRDGEPLPNLDLDDQTYELGSGRLVEGGDAQLTGSKVGDIIALRVDRPDGSPTGEPTGEQPIDLQVLVKRVREKVLPELDDEFASDASEFDTIAELRDDLASRITAAKRAQAGMALRERALEALAQLVDAELPPVLVEHEREHLAASLVSGLERRRVRLGDYLAATGQTEESLLAGLEEQARLQVRTDLALRALAAAESIEVDESDLDEEIVRLSQGAKRSPAQVRADLERSGRIAGLRSELRNTRALAWLVEHVAVVDDEGNPIDRSALLVDDAAGDGDSDADDPEADDDVADDLEEHGDAATLPAVVGSSPAQGSRS